MLNVKRILHIAPGEPFGGLQRVVLDLAKAQSSLHQVAILWTGDAQQAVDESPVGTVGRSNANGCLAARVTTTFKAIRNFDPDIIHLHMAPPWVDLALAGARAGICFHLHGLPSRVTGPKAWLVSQIERRMIVRAETLVAISSWIEQIWRGRYPTARYRRVYNGILVSSNKISDRVNGVSNPPVIGFASRLAHDKGVGEFAAFVLAMHDSLPFVRIKVAGDGPERALLERELNSLIADGKVELLGHVSDMPAFWSGLDLAIFTAPAEPFGLRLIEPIEQGVPVIAYKTGAGSDEIASICAGVATVAYQDAGAMAQLAVQLLADPGRRRAMVRQGRKDIARNFSVSAMAEGIEQVYFEILGGIGRPI